MGKYEKHAVSLSDYFAKCIKKKRAFQHKESCGTQIRNEWRVSCRSAE